MSELNKYGIGFWIGGGIFSIINIIKILYTPSVLLYDYIMTGVAVIGVILSLILLRKKEQGTNTDTKDKYKYGMGFWIGGGIYSLVNMIMHLKNVLQSNILFYNYLITGVAVIGLTLNIILFKKWKNK